MLLNNEICEPFLTHEIFFSSIAGRSLVRLNENSLLRLEIVIPEHRQAILREISKLRLRTNILLLKDMEKKSQISQQQQSQQTASSEVH